MSSMVGVSVMTPGEVESWLCDTGTPPRARRVVLEMTAPTAPGAPARLLVEFDECSGNADRVRAWFERLAAGWGGLVREGRA